jgi:RimJ/RimL family protein N-acetyltransferase
MKKCAYWGQGIGTEAARACVEFARLDLQIKKLVALIVPENIASIRVAEKLGMTRGPIVHIDDMDAFQYEMNLLKLPGGTRFGRPCIQPVFLK